MNKKTENLGRKLPAWSGGLRVWLILVAVIFCILAAFIGLTQDWPRNATDWIPAFLVIFTISGIAAGFFLCLRLFIHWLCYWRNLKRFLFGLACFATLIALFYAEENWRGKHDWEKFKREWEAKGEKFDFASLVPQPVPDGQNFALMPVVASCYGYILTRDGEKIPGEKRDTNLVDRLNFDLGDQDLKTNGIGHWASGTTSNLKPWQDLYRALAMKTNLFQVPLKPRSPAADVLLALSKYDSSVDDLRQAGLLPESRFPLNYNAENPATILLPQLAPMKRATLFLQLRAVAELQNSQNEKALDDIKLMQRLVEAIRSEPFLISDLVRIAMTEILLQPIYEGLASHQWTDAQLIALDEELAKLDFLADHQFAMRGERAMNCKVIDYIGKKNSVQRYVELASDMSAGEDATTTGQVKKIWKAVCLYLMPTGWFDRNKLFFSRQQQLWITDVVVPENHLVSPQKFREAARAFSDVGKYPARPWNFLAKEFSAALGGAGRKACCEQISVDLARMAIALQRYRLAHGKYPESLDVLAPQFIAHLPHDVIGGQPLKYRRTDDGQFILYSVGWNEIDDGGVIGYRKGSTVPTFELGDWVWRYSAK